MKINQLGKFGAALGTLLLLSGLSATPAKAVLITEFDYVVSSGFSAFAPNPGVTPSMTGSLGLPTVLSWGVAAGSGQSALSVSDPIVGGPPDLFTNGALVPGATLTHDNFPIFAPFLTSAQLATVLTLTPAAPPGPTLPPIGPALFNILFVETLNQSDSCPNGQGGPLGSPMCADIFVLLNPADLDVPLGFLGGDLYFYTAHLILEDLAVLTPAQCAAAGAGAGCQGLITAENGTSTFDSFFGITAELRTVPEPGTLGLLGLIFVAMGFVRRRRVA